MARHTGGWIKLHRKILKSWISEDAPSLAIFCTLLMWANRKLGSEMLRGQLVRLRRGQLATSSEDIARKLKLDAKLVERRLDSLEEEGVIVQQKTRRGRIITIKNYELYQAKPKSDVLQDVEQTGNR